MTEPGNYEVVSNRGEVQQRLQDFLRLTPDQQRDEWLNNEFTKLFPAMAILTLSPEGREGSPLAASTLFRSALAAFQNYPLAEKYEHIRQGGRHVTVQVGGPAITASRFVYDIVSEATSGWGWRGSDTTDNLFRVDLAGIIALGLSLPEEDRAKEYFLATYDQLRKSKGTFDQALGLLLPITSVSRKWVKAHGLDMVSGNEWDQSVAGLILSLPQNEIQVRANLPERLPGQLREVDVATRYSELSLDVFLAYSAAYITLLPMSVQRAEDLFAFAWSLKSGNPGYLADDDRLQGWRTIIAATRQSPGRGPSAGTVPNAREILQKLSRNKGMGYKWFPKEVRDLIG